MEESLAESSPLTRIGGQAQFPTTQWSVVLEAGHTDSPQAVHALEKLARMYWYPLYAFLRRRGEQPEDAEDLTQSFFAHLFEHDAFRNLDREKGKFRSFLLAALTNFLRNEYDKRCARKRGGAHEIVSWEQAMAEELYGREPAQVADPAKLFDRRWAFTLVDGALDRLKNEYEAAEKHALFCGFRPHLTEKTDEQFYARKARELGISEGAARVAMHRLRRRFGELLRSEVAHTVASPDQVEEELHYLLAAIAE